MAEVINMPRLSDTMEEGTVASWLKKVGDKVTVLSPNKEFNNELSTAKKGTGDRCYVYPELGSDQTSLRGTIPQNQNSFLVKSASFNPKQDFISFS